MMSGIKDRNIRLGDGGDGDRDNRTEIMEKKEEEKKEIN